MTAPELERQVVDAFQRLSFPIAQLSPTGIVLDCDDARAGRSPCTRAELAGKPPTLFGTTGDRMAAILQQAQKTGVASGQELSLRSKDGSDVSVLLSAGAPMSRGHRVVFLAFVRDITAMVRARAELHQREAALRESEERYRELVENQGEGIGIVDIEERFTSPIMRRRN